MIDIRYASIRELDISNGEGVGAALFVQGCPFMCKNCFNPETWDFNGGKEWTEKTKKEFLELIDRPYIKRISILGGEPLAEPNLDGVLDLITTIREKYPIFEKSDSENPYKSRGLEVENPNKTRLFSDKTIWLYSGYTWEEIFNDGVYISKDAPGLKRRNIVKQCDVMVDGRYIDSQRNVSAKWRGSDNQRVISVQESLKQNKVILYCD